MTLKAENLERYVTLARERLILLAKQGETITYSELMHQIGGPGRGYIRPVLQKVCLGEYEQDRPMLGSLVVLAKTRHPGDGYWESPVAFKTLCRDCTKEEKLDFWQKERQKVYDYWQHH